MERGRWYAYEQVYVVNNVKNQEDGYARSTHNVFVFVGLVDEATDCADLPPFPESSHPRRTQDFKNLVSLKNANIVATSSASNGEVDVPKAKALLFKHRIDFLYRDRDRTGRRARVEKHFHYCFHRDGTLVLFELDPVHEKHVDRHRFDDSPVDAKHVRLCNVYSNHVCGAGEMNVTPRESMRAGYSVEIDHVSGSYLPDIGKAVDLVSRLRKAGLHTVYVSDSAVRQGVNELRERLDSRSRKKEIEDEVESLVMAAEYVSDVWNRDPLSEEYIRRVFDAPSRLARSW